MPREITPVHEPALGWRACASGETFPNRPRRSTHLLNGHMLMRNSQEFLIREYRPTDKEGCVSVFETNLPKFFQPGELAEFKQFLEELPGPYLVIVDTEGVVVGCGGYALSEGSEVADLCWGMVRKELHGKGLGRRLTEARIEGTRRDLSVSRIALHTSQHTRGFYEGMGFRMTDMERDGYGPGLHRCNMQLVVSEGEGGS